MRSSEISHAISSAVERIRACHGSREFAAAVADIIRRALYGKLPHHARQYLAGYADGFKDGKDKGP